MRGIRGFDYIVAPSGSCAGMIRVHYPELFADAPEARAGWKSLSAQTYELTDFLVSVLKVERVPGTISGTVTYHDSCAGLRELGVQAQPRQLLREVAGVSISEMNESTKVLRLWRHVLDRARRDLHAHGRKQVPQYRSD